MDQELEKTIEIWIVEDDEEFLGILTNYLSKTDRIIKSFKCGKDLLVEIKKSSFDILLADLVIPDIDGIEILKIAKRFNPNSIVIIMTGYASLDSAIQAIRGGAYDYIRKPFRLEELEIVIHNAIEKIYLKRDNIKLLNKLERMMQDLKPLRRLWEERLINVIEKWYQSSEHQKNKEIELILKQIFPIPP
ncbi:MAG: response regulator, partial [Bacteroidales bacterium]